MALLVAALGTAAAATVDVDAASRARGCGARGSHTVLQNAPARVYRVRGQTAGQVSGWRYFGCLRSSGRRRLLGESYDDQYVLSASVSDVRLAQTFAAVLSSSTDISCKAACPPGYQPTQTWVRVTDLRSGRVREAATPGLLRHVLLLSPTGHAVWLEGHSGAAQLELLGAHAERRLDQGNIAPSSVKLAGKRLSWTRDGQPHSTDIG